MVSCMCDSRHGKEESFLKHNGCCLILSFGAWLRISRLGRGLVL